MRVTFMGVILWMMGALLSFCLMAVGARELSGDIATFQVLFFRSVIGLVVVSLIICRCKQFGLFATKRKNLHIGRNIFHFAGQYGWFVGIGLLPLAQVFALEFTVPIWTVIIAAIFLKEALTLRKLFAVLFGVLGVYVILNPGSELLDVASIIVLASAVCFSISHVSTKSLSNTEDALTVLFYMCLIQLPIGLVFSMASWVAPNLIQWLWIGIVGLMALTAHYCITRAMKISDAGIVVTLDFLRLPLITVIGILLYHEAYNASLVLGGMLMLLGNLVNIYQPGRKPEFADN